MRIMYYHLGKRVFEVQTDLLPPRGSKIIFSNQWEGGDVQPGALAFAVIDETQAPYEFDYTDPTEVLVRVAVRSFQNFAPD